MFQLTKDRDHLFFEVQGRGHLIGRQFSICNDEPLWKGYAYVMEGNNEVDVDGQERRLDYLGTEDSFTFSWGFKPFIGLRAGITLREKGETCQLLSVYRFHDHMPIRFNKSLRWHINWAMERQFNNRDPLPEYAELAKC